MRTPDTSHPGSQGGALPDGWSVRLGIATTEEQIVQVANRFLETWDEGELARLPSSCLPPMLGTPQAVCNYAFRITQEQLKLEGSPGAREALERMTLFFSLASSRIAQLAHVARIRA